jgi:hypothetical protein
LGLEKKSKREKRSVSYWRDVVKIYQNLLFEIWTLIPPFYNSVQEIHTRSIINFVHSLIRSTSVQL